MSKIFFEHSGKQPTSSARSPTSASRDSSQVSSRWKEVSEKKSPQQSRVERKRGNEKKQRKHHPLSAGIAVNEGKEEEGNSSPFELFNRLEAKRNQQTTNNVTLPEVEIEDEAVLGALLQDSEYDEIDLKDLQDNVDGNDKVIALHEDTSFMNPTSKGMHIAGVLHSTERVAPKISSKTVSLIEELIRKIVDEVTVMKVEGKTETTLTLKHPSMFSGAQVTITEFDSAKKELNIKFEGLTQQAHEIISLQANREALRSALQQKGYNVHIVTANTEIEQPEHVYEGRQDRSGSDSHDQQHQHSEDPEEQN